MIKSKAILLLACGLVTVTASADVARPDIGEVRTWGYQLQSIRPAAVARSDFDLMVIDYSADGSAEKAFSAGQIAYMKKRPSGKQRLLLSYLSIGEAERYRDYWQVGWSSVPPPWLKAENPHWEGNFAVDYWHPDWQAILFGNPKAYLDQILAAGFDGIFLDRIDAYESLEQSRPQAADEMIALVSALANYARNRKPGFLIIPQNGESLLAFPEYLDTVDAIAKEDLFFGYDELGVPTPANEIEYSAAFLDLALSAGKLVLTIDYLTDPVRSGKAMRQGRAHGYVPLVTVVDLDQL